MNIHSKPSIWSVGHLIRRLSCDRLIRCWVSITCELRANNSVLRRRGRDKQTVGAIGSVRRWRPTRAHPLWLSSNAPVSRLNFLAFVPMGTRICLRRETLCFRVAMWDWWEGRLEAEDEEGWGDQGAECGHQDQAVWDGQQRQQQQGEKQQQQQQLQRKQAYWGDSQWVWIGQPVIKSSTILNNTVNTLVETCLINHFFQTIFKSHHPGHS